MNITQILIALIALCFAVITSVLVPIIIKKFGREKIKMVVEQAEQIATWIKIFVAAAEQTFPKEEGEQKKAYVMELITKKLDELGLKVDFSMLDAEVEAQVLALHQSLKEQVE